MLIYKYKAISKDGQVLEGCYKAQSQSDVLAMLNNNNYLPISIEEKKIKNRKVQLSLFDEKVTTKDIAMFCRQFYTMLNAGINIIRCLDILGKQIENKTLKKSIIIVHEDVQKGMTLSGAMKKHSNIFPELLINMIEAGEVSGNLDVIMERMAIHFEKENYIENKIKNAFVYPVLLSVISILVVMFLLVVVMPSFVSMFEDNGLILPGPTRMLLSISNWLIDYWYLFIGIIYLTIFSIISYGKIERGRMFYDGLKIKLPGLKSMNIKIITCRFTRTLSTLISSGMYLLEALDVVSKVVGNKVVSKKLDIVKEDIKKGVPMSTAIRDMNIFSPMVESMISIGEESGSLDELLYKTADFYDEEVENSMEKMTTMLEPILIVLMAIIVGFIVIAMAMPMFDMVNTMEI